MRSCVERIEEINYLIFDGDCGICTRSAQLCEKMDRGSLFEIVPFQGIPEKELGRFDLDHEKCNREVQVITSRGRVHSGTFAVNYFLFKHQPWTIPVLIIYLIPVFLVFEVIGYRLVARHRARVSQWLGLSACRMKQL